MKIRKLYAARPPRFSKSRTPNTPTISSLATNPMIVAIEAAGSANPRGANIHEIPFPITPITESLSSMSV